jgi:hypothetical protein
MSEILIRGMEMPKENDYTIAIVYGDGVVTEYHEDYWIRGADGEKQLGIAIPVPPHGDLIDRDALRDNNCDAFEINGADETILAMDVSIIDDAPAIIPASE